MATKKQEESSKQDCPTIVKARVLVTCVHGKINDVVEVDAAEAKANPDLDPHPDAVAYAESLKG